MSRTTEKKVGRRLQFSLRAGLCLVLVIAVALWASADFLRAFLTGQQPITISGSIWLNGTPVPAATITFVGPGKATRKIQMTTNGHGGFSMKTTVMAGQYFVSIASPPSSARPVPMKYASSATSGLTVTLQPGGDNHFHFQLAD